MEDKHELTIEPTSVPYVVHRDAVAHDRWVIARLVRALIIAVVLVVLSNAMWLYAWTRYDYGSESTETVTTIDSEGDGIANYTGGDGGVIYGQSDSPQTDGDANEN